jgi:protein SCO1/2
MDYWVQKTALTPPTAFLKISFLSLVGLILSCSERQTERLPYYNTPDFTPIFAGDAKSAERMVSHRIGRFSFTNQHNRRVTEKEVDGKVHVANFIFTSCVSICPVMTRHMKILQNEFGHNNDVAMLSFSVTPWIDNVNRLSHYARENQINAANWHLLTGRRSEIYTLARKSYFAEEDMGFTKDSTEFLHTEHIILVDRKARIRGIYNGTLQLDVEQLGRDIRTLLKER